MLIFADAGSDLVAAVTKLLQCIPAVGDSNLVLATDRVPIAVNLLKLSKLFPDN